MNSSTSSGNFWYSIYQLAGNTDIVAFILLSLIGNVDYSDMKYFFHVLIFFVLSALLLKPLAGVLSDLGLLNFDLARPLVKDKNLIKNPEFENGLKHWKVEQGGYFSESGGSGESGALVMRVEPVIEDNRRIYEKRAEQCVAIGESELFTLKADFRYPEARPEWASVNRINVVWYDSIDCSKGGQFGSYLEPKIGEDGWQPLKSNQLVPSLGARSAKIEIVQNQRGGKNTKAIWDNVYFSPSSAETGDAKKKQNPVVELSARSLKIGDNQVENPEFERGIESWHGSRRNAIKWVSDTVSDGLAALVATIQSEGKGFGRGAFDQCIPIGNNKTFAYGARAKISPDSTQDGGGRLRLIWFGEANCKGRSRVSGKHADIMNIKGWQNLAVAEVTRVDGAQSALLDIVHSIKGQGKHVIYWDDFYFKAISE